MGEAVVIPILKCADSIVSQLRESGIDDIALRELQESEVRWHYSNHFMAECKGEEVIEDLLSHTTNKKQAGILGAQLRDEKEHARLFRKIVDSIGFNEGACKYANGYSSLVKEQCSLAEKVFVFQIITEAASSAYCSWRLQAIQDNPFLEVDEKIRSDECRHLKMGHSMLTICDPDEIAVSLSSERRIELLKQMNAICKLTGQQEMASSILNYSQSLSSLHKRTRLDKMVAESIFTEVRSVDKALKSNLIIKINNQNGVLNE